MSHRGDAFYFIDFSNSDITCTINQLSKVMPNEAIADEYKVPEGIFKILIHFGTSWRFKTFVSIPQRFMCTLMLHLRLIYICYRALLCDRLIWYGFFKFFPMLFLIQLQNDYMICPRCREIRCFICIRCRVIYKTFPKHVSASKIDPES